MVNQGRTARAQKITSGSPRRSPQRVRHHRSRAVPPERVPRRHASTWSPGSGSIARDQSPEPGLEDIPLYRLAGSVQTSGRRHCPHRWPRPRVRSRSLRDRAGSDSPRRCTDDPVDRRVEITHPARRLDTRQTRCHPALPGSADRHRPRVPSRGPDKPHGCSALEPRVPHTTTRPNRRPARRSRPSDPQSGRQPQCRRLPPC